MIRLSGWSEMALFHLLSSCNEKEQEKKSREEQEIAHETRDKVTKCKAINLLTETPLPEVTAFV